MADPRTRVGNIQNKLGESYSNRNNEVLPPQKKPRKNKILTKMDLYQRNMGVTERVPKYQSQNNLNNKIKF